MMWDQGRTDILTIEETENQGDEIYEKEYEKLWFYYYLFPHVANIEFHF